MAKLDLTDEQQQRIGKAQNAHMYFDLSRVCSPDLHRLIEGHANAIGSPKEFILLPLLTASASLMGVNANVRIRPEWNEPAILWTVVAAGKGEKKSAAFGRISKPLEVIEPIL